jgi:hypothetical protein
MLISGYNVSGEVAQRRSLRFQVTISPEALDRKSAAGAISWPGWQANGCLSELAYFQYLESLLTTAPKRVDSVSGSEIRGPSIEKDGTLKVAGNLERRGDHSDSQAGSAHCNQRLIRQSALSNFLVIKFSRQTGEHFADLRTTMNV